MISLEVRYFALLKDMANVDQETVLVTTEKTYADLYQTLSKRHHFDLPLSLIKVAVNDEFAEINSPILPGAHIVFIPPVAGG